MKDGAEQLSLFGPDGCAGKMFQVSFPAVSKKLRISGSSLRRSLELKYVMYQSLDLTPGHGNLLGESYWELRSPWRGGASALNTGVSPREERGCSLSQILEDSPHRKYYLSRKACLGILRRARERGKELPPQLKWALEVQAGLRPYCPESTDEVTGEPAAFAANQRDEVRDLHDLAGAVTAQPGMKQQTFIAENCLTPWDTQQARISSPEGVSPTLTGADGGGGRNPGGLFLTAPSPPAREPRPGAYPTRRTAPPRSKPPPAGTSCPPYSASTTRAANSWTVPRTWRERFGPRSMGISFYFMKIMELMRVTQDPTTFLPPCLPATGPADATPR